MPEVSFPGGGQDGEQPLPGVPVRDEAATAAPGEGPEMPGWPPDDWDPDAHMAAFEADLAAGRVWVPAPEPWELEGPSATLSLPDACREVDLAELAAVVGPDGLCREVFDQDRVAAAMKPGPVLAALTESGAGQLARLTPGQLVGMAAAAGRVAARAQYLQWRAVAEFSRSREARAAARKPPPGRAPFEFAAEELAMELVTSTRAAADMMELATELDTRLPRTSAALAAGEIDAGRARIIWRYIRFLSDADAVTADQILAAAAPDLTYEQLARKGLATAMKLDPEAMKRGRDEARHERQRIEARREDTGNASLAGRELAVEDVLASKAHIDALAAALRRGGIAGSLRELRVLVYVDLTQGRNPLDRLTYDTPPGQTGRADTGHTGGTGSHDQPGQRHRRVGHDDGSRGDPAAGDGDPGGDDDLGGGRSGADEDDDAGQQRDPASPSGPSAPFPALINLTIPAGTLFGWSHAPGDAAGWGLLDSDDTRRLTYTAAQHPATRWCFTFLAPDGTATAHGCAPGPHPLPPPSASPRDGPAALMAFLRHCNPTISPIAAGHCDHATAEHRYVPSRALKHLIRARTATCPASGCGAHAIHNDLDHTTAYPAGPTCQCNLSPPCRRHHRAKQAPGWRLEQPEPGVMRWTTPSGRSYTTRPTIYEV